MRPDDAYFWATHTGAELDLLLLKDGRRLGVEVQVAPQAGPDALDAGAEIVRVGHENALRVAPAVPRGRLGWRHGETEVTLASRDESHY